MKPTQIFCRAGQGQGCPILTANPTHPGRVKEFCIAQQMEHGDTDIPWKQRGEPRISLWFLTGALSCSCCCFQSCNKEPRTFTGVLQAALVLWWDLESPLGWRIMFVLIGMYIYIYTVQVIHRKYPTEKMGIQTNELGVSLWSQESKWFQLSMILNFFLRCNWTHTAEGWKWWI